MKNAVVIGAGFTGLAASSLLARDGWKVTLVERNDEVGGRARLWKTEGYTFDMGPSWYLMPEVFERFFTAMGARREDYYGITRLDPAYRVFFEDEESVDVPGELKGVLDLFAGIEEGGDEQLKRYLDESAYKYDTAMREFLYRDYNSVLDLCSRRLIFEGSKLHIFQRLDRHTARFFKDHRSRKIVQYPTVFLGSSPSNTPALYSLMSHVDMNLGVWFPTGGMGAAALGMARLARESGVEIVTGREVRCAVIRGRRIVGVETRSAGGEPIEFPADAVLNTADYQWFEEHALDKKNRRYSSVYWKRRVVAPSMFLAYLGMNRKLPELAHHNLYFAREWERHFDTIFRKRAWPENPSWYLSRVTATAPGMAPAGRENIFLLVPVAPSLEDSDERREEYFDYVLRHIRKGSGVNLGPGREVTRIFTHRDFSKDYNAFQGSALGLSHTKLQTAVFRPARRSRRLKNLYHAGQFTHPGVGVPMVMISAELAARAMTSAQGGGT